MFSYLQQFFSTNQEVLTLVLKSSTFSLVPILIWAAIFLYKHGEKREMVVKAFSLGAVLVIPFIFYRKLWDVFPILNVEQALKGLATESIQITQMSLSLPLSLAIMFATLGCLEEYLKHKAASKIDHAEINSIDDAIEFSIIAALGFAFAENTFYFIEIWQNAGPDLFYKLVVFRSIFSTFAHILFSSIYGYHFGLALFADPIIHNPENKSFYKKIIHWIHCKTNFRDDVIFKDYQLFLGLFTASVLHGLYNILLELRNTIFLVPFLILGFSYIMKLISDQKNQIEYKKAPNN